MKVMLKNARLSFNDLFEATQVNGQGDHKFRGTFLIEKESDQHKEIEAAIIKTATEKWGAKAAGILQTIRSNPMRFNVQDGDIAAYDGYAGNIVVRASSKSQPSVFDQKRNHITKDSGKIYSGCYVNAAIEFFAYENQGKGISASLRGVQFVKDGEAFAGSPPAAVDEFEELAVDSALDPMFD